MIHEAAERLVAEQQRHAPRSSLHKFGRRLNKTVKLVLAVPSDPQLKTYSKTQSQVLVREFPFPVGGGGLTLQRRVPTADDVLSRPANSQRTTHRAKQTAEVSRRPGGPAALQAPYHSVQSRPDTRPLGYRESESTLWYPYEQPRYTGIPAHKGGQAFSTTFSDEGTLMPTQEQLGNPKWERPLPPPPPGFQAPRVTTSAGALEPPRQMPLDNVHVPSKRYAASIKSYETTAIPTQSKVWF